MDVFTDLYVLKFFGEYVKLEPWVTSLCKYMGYEQCLLSIVIKLLRLALCFLVHWKLVSSA